MKLIIQIPCLNEQNTLPQTLKDLPKTLPGVDEIEILVIDDGSTDGTVETAKKYGVHHIVSFKKHQGLAQAFATGLTTSLALGADLIVNTDADHQYPGRFVSDLLRPIFENKADIVIGCRPMERIDEFSWMKKRLQRWGSRVVSFLSKTYIPDVTCGFRAFTRTAALTLNVISMFTYTVETIIQAGQRSLAIGWVNIETNAKTRPSRLFRNNFVYITRSIGTILRIFTQFQPLATYLSVGTLSFLIGVLPALRFLYHLSSPNPVKHTPSLILCAIFLLFGSICCLIGLLADQVAGNRHLLEDLITKTGSLQYPAQVTNPNLIYSVKTRKLKSA